MSDWRNVTVSVRWETYYYVREWAAQQNMSISAAVARFLENLPTSPGTSSHSRANAPALTPLPPTQRFEQIYDALHLTNEE